METLSTTRMSSKGQVVIPESIRNSLGLASGTQFVVVAEGDVLILKVIRPPSMEEFDGIIAKARKQVKSAGLTRKDVESAVRVVRKRK
jgi:AbrB family looped-hinge helix DNA binding protein